MNTTDAYYLSHLGLGDNIINIGAVVFLSQFYKKIYFFCSGNNTVHINFFFKGTNIYIIEINKNNKHINLDELHDECFSILNDKYENNDIYISGFCHTQRFYSKITNLNVLKYIQNQLNQNCIRYDIPNFFNFAVNFYKDINLNASIMVDYFNPKNDEIINLLYDKISNYEIFFFHTLSSSAEIDLSQIVEEFINDETKIVICSNKNFYEKNSAKYYLAEEYINLPTIFHYIEIIKNSKEIHIVDSCISCVSLILHFKNILKYKKFVIYNRETSQPVFISIK